MINIELATEEEMEAFKVFRENQGFFTILINSEVHKLRNGNAQLNFNNERLCTVVMTQTIYKK